MLLRSARHLIAIVALLPGAMAATDRYTAIPTGWEYRLASDDIWHNMDKFDARELRSPEGLWIRHNIPELGAHGTQLVFTSFSPRFSVYVDTALIYDHNGLSRLATIHVVPLPPAGKEIEIWVPHLDYGSFGIRNPYVAATESVPAVIQRILNEPLRRDLPDIAVGLLIFAFGLAVLTIYFVRRRARSYAFIYLAAFSMLYGARLLVDSQWISFVIGEPTGFWSWPVAFITYTIGIPGILLARHALGPGWKSSLDFAVWMQVAFSIIAICSDLICGVPLSAERLNTIWVLLFTAAVLGNMVGRRTAPMPGRRVLATGFGIFIATVANANLTALGITEWRPFGQRLEPYGFLALLACFAYFVARQAFLKEERFLAVEVELDTARRIQQSILPLKIPSVDQLAIAARYLPMTAVAGDFYDFIQVDGNRLGILVADVSGHGVPAALVASMVKIAFAGQADRAADPAGVLSGMNEVLHGRVQRQFVTAVYAFIDAAGSSLVYASAGHPPPLLRRAETKTIEPLKQGGLVLGPFRKTPYTNIRVDFSPGDRLLLYTDGITEAANSTEEFYGDRSFERFIQERDRSGAEQFTEELVKDVRRWSPSQADDLTVVTVDHIGKLARLAITAALLVLTVHAQAPAEFVTRCAACHGGDARGGERGPSLATRRARSEDQLRTVIRRGMPGMPAFDLPAAAETQIVTFLLSLTPSKTAADSVVALPHSIGPHQDWPTYHGDPGGNRQSPLRQITTQNVAHLAPQWIFTIPNSRHLEVTPVVIDGVMYVTNANEAFALDALAGRQIWHYQRPRTKGLVGDAASGINRGVAVLGDRLFMVTDHAHLLALNRVNGELIWDVEMADYQQHYGATSAPLVAGGLVISGVSGGDEGARGFVAAYRASTGERVWRFWSMPAPGEPLSETWIGRAIEHGCATTWLTGTYDTKTNLLFWPTGNPCPDYNGDERQGDNLYSDSVLALEPESGKLRWHYQFTPHDMHDWDAQATPMVVDTDFHGRRRELLLQANRNGFFYVLDRTTGAVLLAKPFVKKLTWASGIDAQGRPQLLPGAEPTVEGTKACPAVEGATNWMSTAWNAAARLFYVMALEKCDIYSKSDAWWEPGKSFYGGSTHSVPGEPGQKVLRAIDIQTGKIAWEYPQIGPATSWGGVLSTAGGLVFFGDDSGAFAAVDGRTGKPLWHFYTNENWKASPMTYVTGGRQFIAIASGPNIIAFGLQR